MVFSFGDQLKRKPWGGIGNWTAILALAHRKPPVFILFFHQAHSLSASYRPQWL